MRLGLEVMVDVFWGGRKMGFSVPNTLPFFLTATAEQEPLSTGLTAVCDVFSILAFRRRVKDISCPSPTRKSILRVSLQQGSCGQHLSVCND